MEKYIENKDISYQLSTLLEQVNHEIYNRNRSNNVNYRSQGKILKILAKQGNTTQKELQNHLKIQPGTMSEIVTKLESKAFVTRSRDPIDHRKVILSITEKGLQNVEEYHMHFQNNTAEFFEVLNEEEKEELECILKKLLNQTN